MVGLELNSGMRDLNSNDKVMPYTVTGELRDVEAQKLTNQNRCTHGWMGSSRPPIVI